MKRINSIFILFSVAPTVIAAVATTGYTGYMLYRYSAFSAGKLFVAETWHYFFGFLVLLWSLTAWVIILAPNKDAVGWNKRNGEDNNK